MLKLLGLVCAGVFVSAAYIELLQIRSRRNEHNADPPDDNTTDEKTDGDARQEQ